MLELNSFVGGENTVGSDHELPLNQSRRMENWEVLSLGGMQRSKGFDAIASGVPEIGSAVFDGTGLDDATSSGVFEWTEYANASGSIDYDVQIVSEGTPDTFKWRKDSGAWASGIAIPASGYTLSEGVDITWSATTGHTLDDLWEIKATAYQDQFDFLIQAEASGTQAVLGVIEGDVVLQDSTTMKIENAGAFTSGELCHGLSVNDTTWITNSTDNLKSKVIDGPTVTPADVPPAACDRIYYHKFRLIAEGGSNTVYGSRVQPGYWSAADAWSLTNDAWNITLPDETQGMAMGFPTGDDVTVFTERQSFSLTNFPNVAHKPRGSVGCSAPYSIAVGNEGVYFLSKFPNKAVVLWNGVNWKDITEYQDFVDDINFDQRIFGRYNNRKYFLFYASTDSAATYPDTLKVYDAIFDRWFTRKLNPALGDNFGYPATLGFTDNELYIGSSKYDTLYELNGDYETDDGEDTIAVYETKNFSSKDFTTALGGDFPLPGVAIKLIKSVMTAKGTDGLITLNWTADRGRHTGSQTFDLNSEQSGDKVNLDFIMNESYIIARPEEPEEKISKSFNNKAVGELFSFQINNSGDGDRPIVQKIIIHGIALEQN